MKSAILFIIAGVSTAFAQTSTCPKYAVTVTPLPVTLTITANATTITAPTPTKYVTVPCPSTICKPQTCGNFLKRCDTKNDCWCGKSAEGTAVCFQNSWCSGLKQCGTTRDCPQGYTCFVETCCGIPVCVSTTCKSPNPIKRGLGGSMKYKREIATDNMIAFKKGEEIPSFDASMP
ncbi:hypothetical protein H072_8322 [Dactylellina haptotyla CBS 200.50]|uniref:Uncharacterized protein n=1 Tax=Dactylellina haptotyla (strain CBS 200.50) TaxID=1284197 RepID=S8A4P7_DACHA|nr:hypothetical protein H072_8322 [Dactylellina haptotyla CBS 200.50]